MLAAARVLNDIASALDNKQDCAALFIDLTKAFDTVDHSRLLQHLNAIGFDVKFLNWFKNYLTGRRQAVVAPRLLMMVVIVWRHRSTSPLAIASKIESVSSSN